MGIEAVHIEEEEDKPAPDAAAIAVRLWHGGGRWICVDPAAAAARQHTVHIFPFLGICRFRACRGSYCA